MDGPSIQHPLLGQVYGKQQDGVIQFLGIPYATLRDRLSPAQLVQPSPNRVVDATKYGPPVISPPESLDIEMSFIQQSLPPNPIPPPSGLGGLNLNITVPCTLPQWEGLPVLVYIHGGGFVFGSSTYPHYDQVEVVRQAAARGSPIIAININYRLGIPGFLTSAELRSAGYQPNNGLQDQKVALRWVQRYIAGFGGDPASVTVVGQSAGAASVHYHLASGEALFRNAVLLSGTAFLMPPATEESAEVSYRRALALLGLSGKAPEERIQALTHHCTAESLGGIPLQVPMGPMIDAKVIPEPPTFGALSGATGKENGRCKLMLVDLQLDATILAHVNLQARLDGMTASFIGTMDAYLGVDDARKLLTFYHINPKSTDSETMSAVVCFLSDTLFYAPAAMIGQHRPGSVVAHFNEGNPWPGIHQSEASHLLDTAFLWQNYNPVLPPAARAIAETFASDIIAFMYGGSDPKRFPEYQRDGKVITYGPSAKGKTRDVVSAVGEGSGRRVGFFLLAHYIGGLDRVRMAARGFLDRSI